MKRFGLIGFPLKNKFSVNYFTEKFKSLNLDDYSYENFPIENIEELIPLIENNSTIFGLNITIPHKISIIKYLDELDESAVAAGAVNCVKIVRKAKGKRQKAKVSSQNLLKNKDYKLIGYNTDIYGFEKYLSTFLSDEKAKGKRQKAKVSSRNLLKNKDYKLIGYNTDIYGFEKSLSTFLSDEKKVDKALILGTGGAAKAVACVFKKLKIDFAFVSRKVKSKKLKVKSFSYEMLDEKILTEHLLIINCTPVGMFPNENEAPLLPYQFITSQHFAFDLIYHPSETLFLKYFRERGAKTKNGLEMLHLQADKSFEIFTT